MTVTISIISKTVPIENGQALDRDDPQLKEHRDVENSGRV